MPALETALSRPARIEFRERVARNPATPHEMNIVSMKPMGRAGLWMAIGMPFSIPIFNASRVPPRKPNRVAHLTIASHLVPRVLPIHTTATAYITRTDTDSSTTMCAPGWDKNVGYFATPMAIIVRFATINASSTSAIWGRRQITMDRSSHARLIGHWDRLVRAIPVNQRVFWDSPLDYCSFAYSALACLRMGMSGSASFQRVKKSLQAAGALAVSPCTA
jgi:hypothetical protein